MAYATDPAIFDDFEADLTSLLEVPDLDFSSSQDFPRATYRDSAFASTSAAAGEHLNRKERLHLSHQFNEKPSIQSGCALLVHACCILTQSGRECALHMSQLSTPHHMLTSYHGQADDAYRAGA